MLEAYDATATAAVPGDRLQFLSRHAHPATAADRQSCAGARRQLRVSAVRDVATRGLPAAVRGPAGRPRDGAAQRLWDHTDVSRSAGTDLVGRRARAAESRFPSGLCDERPV